MRALGRAARVVELGRLALASVERAAEEFRNLMDPTNRQATLTIDAIPPTTTTGTGGIAGFDPARAVGKIIRVPATGTTWFVSADRRRHWIPDGHTYNCLKDGGVGIIDGLTQAQADTFPDGAHQPACLSRSGVAGAIVRVPATGTAYLMDGAGSPHWIPDVWTYGCLVAQGHRVIQDGITQAHVDTLGDGKPWAARCIDRDAVRHRTLRAADTGTAYTVDDDGTIRWIPDGWTYGCVINERGYGLIDGLTQEQVNSIGAASAPEQPRCIERAAVRHHTLRAADTGAAYTVDDGGTIRWIPDGWTYGCVINERGYGLIDGLTQEQLNSIGAATAPWQPRCIERAAVRHRTLRAADTGTTYAVDDNGTIRWIPDGWTYGCMIKRYGYGLIDGLTQEQVNSLGAATAPWQPRCLNPGDVAGHVLRVSATGTTYAADGGGRPLWIKDGGTYNCFVQKYHWPVIDGLTQQHVDSIGNGQPWAQCS